MSHHTVLDHCTQSTLLPWENKENTINKRTNKQRSTNRDQREIKGVDGCDVQAYLLTNLQYMCGGLAGLPCLHLSFLRIHQSLSPDSVCLVAHWIGSCCFYLAKTHSTHAVVVTFHVPFIHGVSLDPVACCFNLWLVALVQGMGWFEFFNQWILLGVNV